MRLTNKLTPLLHLATNYLLLCLVLSSSAMNSVFAQRKKEPPEISKPPLDTSAFNKWLWVEDKAAISNDGSYVFYKTREGYYKPATLIVQALNSNWKMELPDVGNAVFTEDSRKTIFIKSKDSLCLLTLGSSVITYIPHVQSFQLFSKNKTAWLVYLLNTADKKLILHDLGTGKERSYTSMIKYLPNRDGNILVLHTRSIMDSTVTQSLHWINLADGSNKVFWEGKNAGNLVLDDKHPQLAFVVEDTINNRAEKSFWYYKSGEDKAIQLVNNQSAGIDNDLQLEGISNFSRDGSKLFILFKGKDVLLPKADAVQVDVWSYTDAKLQSQQLHELKYDPNTTYTAVIHLDNRRIIRLQRDGERVLIMPKVGSDNFVVMDDTKGDGEDMNWSVASEPSYYVVSTKNGERKQIRFMVENISSDGKYLIGYLHRNRHPEDQELCSYEIATGKIYNISESIPAPLEINEMSLRTSKSIRSVTWLVSDTPALLVYDKFDIWQVDPAGKDTPINVSNGYGRKNNVVLRLANDYDYWYAGKTVAENEKILLQAFNVTNKNAGFYRLSISSKGDPEQLSMGPYDYNPGIGGKSPIKARDAAVYLVKRSSATKSPNYFRTKDFKNFTPVSDIYPEKKYNWLSTELIFFKTVDGDINQAVMYKPGNFDSTKKYPVILSYYEQKSNDLNKYQRLFGNDAADISIDWLVSRGYLVVTPDIHYKMGKNGQCALNTVLGLTNYLSNLAWVDSAHIGIHGQSFGGFETNYIVTHTNRFAAAISSSGISNLISDYGSLWGHGISKQGYYQNRQGRISTTLWESPDIYIQHSPIFHIDKITTPLLTVANKNDGNVSFGEGLQLFLALRRLGKKAWMLQYDGATHGLNGKAFIDYTIRSQQFFDHYLKGAPAPKWMTRGIPASMKGIDDGLELDHEIKTPGEGLLTPEEKKKVEAPKKGQPVRPAF